MPLDGLLEPVCGVGFEVFSGCSFWSHFLLPHLEAAGCFEHQDSEYCRAWKVYTSPSLPGLAVSYAQPRAHPVSDLSPAWQRVWLAGCAAISLAAKRIILQRAPLCYAWLRQQCQQFIPKTVPGDVNLYLILSLKQLQGSQAPPSPVIHILVHHSSQVSWWLLDWHPHFWPLDGWETSNHFGRFLSETCQRYPSEVIFTARVVWA